jgi:hypothetical protein
MNRNALGTIIGCVLALALVAFVPHARADERDQASQLTFNEPVELPGNHVLPAGTYWFVAPDSVNGGQTVQVFNANRTQLLATMETISTERPDITGNTQLTFGRVSNRPLMLVSWFYPGEKIGHQFVYSPRLESRLSEGSQVTVTARSGSAVSVG